MCTFDIVEIEKKFTACVDGDDILLHRYCDAYIEISGLLTFFGKIFYFVAKDVDEKIKILYEYSNRNPVTYRSVKSMTAYEASLGVTGKVYKKQADGARTILRLNRALLFVVDLIESVCTAPESYTLRQLAKDVYTSDLGPYHSWPIRRAVSLAMYAMPHREDLVNHIIESQPEDGQLHGREACRVAMVEHALPAMRNVHDSVSKWLEFHGQSDLP